MKKKDGPAEGPKSPGQNRSGSPNPQPEDREQPGLGTPPGGGAPEPENWPEDDLQESNPEDAETLEQAAPEAVSAEQRASEYLEQLQRLKAEFDNYRRRTSREREEWFAAARVELVRSLVPVLDDLRRARAHNAGEAPDAAGLLLILKRFEDILTQLGLEKQEAVNGQEFDPEQHEAVMTGPSSEVPEGAILRTLEPGYLFQGRLLRPSKVAVSSGPAPE